MPSPAPAADTGLPNLSLANFDADDSGAVQHHCRRGFLRQLAALPLIGGSISLLGRPRAVAEPVTLELMDTYKTWLDHEQRSIAWEIAQHPEIVTHYRGMSQAERFSYIRRLTNYLNPAGNFHQFDGSDPASGRAALVLSTVGCDWRGGEGRPELGA